MDLSTKSDLEFNALCDFLREGHEYQLFPSQYRLTTAQEKSLAFEYDQEVFSGNPFELDGIDYSLELHDGCLEVDYCEEVGGCNDNKFKLG